MENSPGVSNLMEMKGAATAAAGKRKWSSRRGVGTAAVCVRTVSGEMDKSVIVIRLDQPAQSALIV